MKHKQKLMGFVSGCLATAALITTPMAAEVMSQMVEVFTGVQVYVDDKKIDAGKTNGNPEAFIYNGTTYVAVAAVSNSLGETVRWDGSTRSVYIGKHGETPSILDVCPPYVVRDMTVGKEGDYVTMAGEKYVRSLSGVNSEYGYALFNLNGKYDTLTFDLGHVDSSAMGYRTMTIYVDGIAVYEEKLNPEMLVTHYEVPLNGALQMKIVFDYANSTTIFAMTNMTLK